jgi:hypothetical protein
MEPIEQQPKTLVDMVAQIDEWLAHKIAPATQIS